MIGLVVSVDGFKAECEKAIEVYRCAISSPGIVRSGSRYNASVADAGSGATYEWTVSGGSILSGQGTREIEWRCDRVMRTSIGVNVSVSRDGMVSECHKEWDLRSFS
ncbi:MAG: hypothetical protein JW986_02625 [Methanotrichaceae archaeon]|nr:hypothetical protein [Methanotrichaceae archaeon]